MRSNICISSHGSNNVSCVCKGYTYIQFTFTFTYKFDGFNILVFRRLSIQKEHTYLYSNLLSSLLSFTCDRPVLRQDAITLPFSYYVHRFLCVLLCVSSYRILLGRRSCLIISISEERNCIRVCCIVVAGIL